MADNAIVEEHLVGSSENIGENTEEKVSRSNSPVSPKSDDEGLGVNSDDPIDKEAEVSVSSTALDNDLSSENVEQEVITNTEKEEYDDNVEEEGNLNVKSDNDEDPINVSDSEGVREKSNNSLEFKDTVEDENIQKELSTNEEDNQQIISEGNYQEPRSDNDEIIDTIDNKTPEDLNGSVIPDELEVECEENQIENTENEEPISQEIIDESKFSRELSCISEKEDEVNEEQTETEDYAPIDNEENVIEETITETITENVENSILNSFEPDENRPVEEEMDDVYIEQVEAAMIPETCSEKGDESTDVEVNLPIKYESDTQLQWAMEILLGKTFPVLDTSYSKSIL